MENKYQPINPTTYSKSGDGPNDYDPLIPNKKTGWERQFGGLTKIEYASIEAMKGILSARTDLTLSDAGYIAHSSITIATELLNKLEDERRL